MYIVMYPLLVAGVDHDELVEGVRGCFSSEGSPVATQKPAQAEYVGGMEI